MAAGDIAQRPMLGLVATMIPMGPALLALTESDAKGIGENLVIAFRP